MKARILDRLLLGLGGLILLIFITGGGVFVTPPGFPIRAKLEVASVDLWMAIWALLLALRFKLKNASPPAFWTKTWERFSRRITSPEKSPRDALTILGLCGLTLFLAHVLRHWSLRTDAYDVHFLHQALFYPWQGLKPLQCDLCIGGSYLGEHLAFTLFALSPLTRWLAQDEWVFAIQTLLLTVPLFFALKKGPLAQKKSMWFLAIFIPLCERSLRNSMVWDFREDALAYAFAFLALISLWKGRIAAYFPALLGFIASKENFAFLSAGLALPILFAPQLPFTSRQRKGLALLTLLLSGAWIYFAFSHAIPHFSMGAEKANQIVARFPGWGETPQEVFIHLLSTPSAWGELLHQQLFSKASLKYLFLLFGPFLCWIIQGTRKGQKPWLWLMPALPGVAMNLLSAAPTQRSLSFHYDLAFLPFLTWSAWVGLQSMQRLPFFPLLLTFALSGSWPGRSLSLHWPSLKNLQHSRYLRSIDQSTPLAAGHIPLAHLSRAPRLFEIAEEQTEQAFRPARRLQEAQRFLLDRSEPFQQRLLERLYSDGGIKKSQSEDGRFVELTRGAASNP